MKITNRFHYGWIVIAGGFLCYMCWSISRHLYPYVLPTMETELNLLHESMGNIASTYFIAYAIMTFVWGILADRIGPRKCMLIGMVIILVGLSGMGFISSPIAGFLCYFLCGAGAAGISVPIVPLISHWFGGTRRGIALGITSTGCGTATVMLGFVIPMILVSYSWQWSWWVGGAFVLIIAVICRFLLVDSPAEKGLTAAGANNEKFLSSPRQQIIDNPEQIETKVTIRDILKRGVTWNLGGIYFTYGIGYVTFMTFAVAYLEEIGWGVEAAAVFATWGALSIPGCIIWGAVADHIAKKYVFAIVMALQAVGLYIFLGGSPVGGYVGAAIIGFGNAGVPVTMGASMANYFKPTMIGTSFGLMTLMLGIACIISPTIGGAIADRTGTLSTAILLSLGAIILSFVLALLLKKPPKLMIIKESN